jgi:glycosyltransferase involved in cell wall biosynthesis
MTALRAPGSCTRATRDKVVLSCLGLTSHAKGTDTMLRAVESVVSRNDTHQIQFVIQVDREELARFAEPATCTLVNDLSRHPQVRFVESGVNSDKYEAMILESDCIVLPYRAMFYRYIQSGVFLEAVAAGRAVIVPRDTAMGRDCADYSLGLMFKSEDAEGLAGAMTEMAMTIDKWLMAVRSNRGALLSKHAIDRYVETLLYYAPTALHDSTCAVTKLEHQA